MSTRKPAEVIRQKPADRHFDRHFAEKNSVVCFEQENKQKFD
jgi:hypothetical protein